MRSAANTEAIPSGSARGVAGGRARGHRPRRRCPESAAHGFKRRGRPSGEDEQEPTPGAALAARPSRARRAPAAARYAAAVPAERGGLLNLDNFRRREWAPAIEAGAISTPARIYDLRSTFASNALAAGIDVFELARVMGHVDRDDRAPLRDTPVRCRRRDRQPPGRLRGRARSGQGRRPGRLGHYRASAGERRASSPTGKAPRLQGFL